MDHAALRSPSGADITNLVIAPLLNLKVSNAEAW